MVNGGSILTHSSFKNANLEVMTYFGNDAIRS